MRTIVKALCVALLAAACARGGDTYELRLGHDQPDGHPYDIAVDTFAARVRAATSGVVDIRVFPAAQLGDSPEQFEGMQMGTLDMALAAFSHASQFCPEFGLFSAPFLFESEAHFDAVFDGDVGTTLEESCSERYAVRLLSTFTSGYRVLFNGKRPIDSAADLRGMKIRVMGGEADALTWQTFGAIPVPMPYSEVYSALQAGVIDGAENEAASILANKFYETAEYVAETNHLVLPMGLFIGNGAWDRLPEEYRTALREQARGSAIWQRELMTQRNEAALTEMRERFGAHLSALRSEELRAPSIAIQDRVAQKLGVTDLLQRVRAAAR
jgi:tripartite ATP-independent transporter DctP family solute receptor